MFCLLCLWYAFVVRSGFKDEHATNFMKIIDHHEISICREIYSLSCFQESKEANLSEESLRSQGNRKLLQIHSHNPLTEEETGKPFPPLFFRCVCVCVEIFGVKPSPGSQRLLKIKMPVPQLWMNFLTLG